MPFVKKVIILLFFSLLPATIFAQKNDTVVLQNNNILTGEIKNLEFGLLTFKTDGMGTVKIKSEELKSLKSNKRFQIQLNNGYIYFGSFDTVNGPGAYVKIITSSKTVYKTEIKNIILIYQFRKKIWSRLSGTFSLGMSYSKSSTIFQTNFSGNLKYWGKRRQVTLSWTDNISAQNDSIITNKQSNSLSYKHYVKKRFSAQGFFEYSKNKELNLQHRFSLNLLGGMDVVHRYRSLLYFGTGVSGNSELYTNDTTNKVNMEWVFQMNFEIFKRSHPELSFFANTVVYPSLTVANRYRINSVIEGRIEIFNNFYIGIQFYDDFDNKPQGDDTDLQSHTNDWGVNGTISYSFH